MSKSPCPVCFQVMLTIDEIRELITKRLPDRPDEVEWLANLLKDSLDGKVIDMEAL